MVDQYKVVAQQVGLESSAKQAQALALRRGHRRQLIEREVNKDEYRDKVPGCNRLAKKMPLGLDSIIYAEDLETNTTTPQDRASKSPYNTYRYKGCPGPISAPGRLPWTPLPIRPTASGCI